jgi:hypothetical protein
MWLSFIILFLYLWSFSQTLIKKFKWW